MAAPAAISLFTSYPDGLRLFLIVFVSANFLTGLLYLAAKRWKLLPSIRDRDVHTKRKPRIGGIAMWTALVGAMAYIVSTNSALLDFNNGGSHPYVLHGVVGGLIALLIFGLLDDLFGLAAGWQLLGHTVAGLSIVLGGVGVDYLTLPGTVLHFQPFWSAAFTVFWVVIMINAINLFDGLDGLAGSITGTSAVILFVLSVRLGFVGAATLAILLFSVVAGFLPWNWHPSKLFMGTVGSQMLGFLLGVIAIISGAKMATAVLVLGLPLFDAVSVVLRRLKARQSPFQADQRHLHHRLLKLGLKPPAVVLITNGVAIVFGALALGTQQAQAKLALIILLVLALLGVVGLTYLLEQRSRRHVQ